MSRQNIEDFDRDQLVEYFETNATEGFTKNPETGRKIKIDGPTYRKLLAKTETQNAVIRPSEDPVSCRDLAWNLTERAMKGYKRTYVINHPEDVQNYVEYLQESQVVVRDIVVHDFNTHRNISFVVFLSAEFSNEDNEKITGYFWSVRYFINNLEKIDQYAAEAHDTIAMKIEKFQKDGSGWYFEKVLMHTVNISVFLPLKGKSYIKLPKELQNSKKGLINPNNQNDNECFRWCHLIHLAKKENPNAKNLQRISKLKHYLDKVDYEGIRFPVTIKVIPVIERKNSIRINVFFYDGVTSPLYISKADHRDEMNLLMISDGENNHFVYMRDFDTYMFNQTKHKAKKNFCMYCLQCFSRPDVLIEHKKVCLAINGKQTVVMPDSKFGKPCVKFKNFRNMLRAPFIIYADFEAIIEKQNELRTHSEQSFTHEFQNHKVCGFAYKVVCVDPRFTRETVVHRGEDAGQRFLAMILEEEERCVQLMEKHFNQPMRMTAGDEESFQRSAQCHICKGSYFTRENDKVRDHCHITGNFRGAAHRYCNQNFQISKKIPVVFHNLRGYDGHIIMQNIAWAARLKSYKIDVIPNSMERYMAFFLGKRIRFIDSFQFMSSSLDKLSQNLEQFPFVSSEFSDTELVTKKGVYPYEYIDSFHKFGEQCLPAREKFFSTLTGSHISAAEYQHACNVWEKFQIASLGEYHDLYLKTDVLLLTDVFENFRNVCMGYYDLDPAHYFSSPGLSWNALLKMSRQKLELLTDIDMHLMFEQGTRGGVSYISHRYAKANNKHLDDYAPDQESSYITYLDANNLYGCAMSEPLPTGNFRWKKDFDPRRYGNGKGAILKVDLEYPAELHELHNDYPLAPEQFTPATEMLSDYCQTISEKFKIKTGRHRKLIPNLLDKAGYVVHYKNLMQYLDMGLVVKKVHAVLEFDESPWMKSYVDFNTRKRKEAKNPFEKDFFKLMNNSVFGKTMENIRKRVCVKLICDPEKFKKWASRPTYISSKVFNANEETELVAMHMIKQKLVLNKPIYVGMSILDLSKIVIYDFHYNYIKKKFGNRSRLLFTDTDSLTYQIFTEDIYEDFWEDREKFDFSEYPEDSPYHDKQNKKVLGKFKDEAAGELITEFVGLRSKMYSYQKVSGSSSQTVKGIVKAVKKNQIRHDMYKETLFGQKEMHHSMISIKSENHQIGTYQINKKSLSCFDDKRFILEDGFTTLAYGYKKV